MWYKLNIEVKNPNWWEADQLAQLTQHGGVEFEATEDHLVAGRRI